MDHDSELLREEIVYATRTELRGPIPEFLAKKHAEQAPGTAAGHEVAFGVFERFCTEGGVQTVGQIAENVAHDFITAERQRGMSARTIHDRVRKLKTWTRWMRKRGWTERDRWEDVQTPRADLAEFDLIDPELRSAAFGQFDARTFLGARNQAILALLSDCGVRRDEFCIIKDADVNLTDMQVRVYAARASSRQLRPTRGRIICPECGTLVERDGGRWLKDAILDCGKCGWRLPLREYFKTYQHKHLVGGGAVAFHAEYIDRLKQARSPRVKMLAIDRLIHAYHWELAQTPGRSAARELIYAKNYNHLLTFLDTLSHGEQRTSGLKRQSGSGIGNLQAGNGIGRWALASRLGRPSPPIPSGQPGQHPGLSRGA
jgi:predicted RNA-binding Zn-ribbon protein involved in translation (DUF1610 family)